MHKVFEWEASTVKHALQLNFACSRRGYEFLLEQNFPLPSLRTFASANVHFGVLTDVFAMLVDKVSTMEVHARDCCVHLMK